MFDTGFVGCCYSTMTQHNSLCAVLAQFLAIATKLKVFSLADFGNLYIWKGQRGNFVGPDSRE